MTSSGAGGWIALTVVAGLLAFAVPVAVGATGIFPDFPMPDDLPEGVEPVATGQEATITSGETSGLNWRLTANESDTGLCVNLEFPDSSGGSCGFGLKGEKGIAGEEDFSVIEEIDFASETTFIYGPATSEVDRITVYMDDGQTLTPSIKDGPPQSMNDFGFFITSVPRVSLVETAVARNAEGAVVDRMKFPPPSEDMLDEPPNPAPEDSHEHHH